MSFQPSSPSYFVLISPPITRFLGIIQCFELSTYSFIFRFRPIHKTKISQLIMSYLTQKVHREQSYIDRLEYLQQMLYIYFLEQKHHCSHSIHTPTDSSSTFFRLAFLQCFSTNREHYSFYYSFFKCFFYYNNQVLNKKILEDVQLLKKE